MTHNMQPGCMKQFSYIQSACMMILSRGFGLPRSNLSPRDSFVFIHHCGADLTDAGVHRGHLKLPKMAG